MNESNLQWLYAGHIFLAGLAECHDYILQYNFWVIFWRGIYYITIREN